MSLLSLNTSQPITSYYYPFFSDLYTDMTMAVQHIMILGLVDKKFIWQRLLTSKLPSSMFETVKSSPCILLWRKCICDLIEWNELHVSCSSKWVLDVVGRGNVELSKTENFMSIMTSCFKVRLDYLHDRTRCKWKELHYISKLNAEWF